MTRQFLGAMLLCAAAVMPENGLAGEPFEGRWALDAAGCEGLNDGRMEIVPGEMRFHETRCALERVQPLTVDGAWEIEALCRGEGESWTRRMILLLHGEHWTSLSLFEGDFIEFGRCR